MTGLLGRYVMGHRQLLQHQRMRETIRSGCNARSGC